MSCGGVGQWSVGALGTSRGGVPDPIGRITDPTALHGGLYHASLRKYPTRIKALFMHYVSMSRPSPPPPRDRALLDVPVIYFRTYVGAAVKAAELGLLGPSGVEAVVARTLEEIEGGGSAAGEGKGMRKRKATAEQVAEVMADIALAEAFMGRSKAGKEGRKQRRGGEALELVRELFRPPDTRLPARVSIRR